MSGVRLPYLERRQGMWNLFAAERDAVVNPVGDASDLARAMGALNDEIRQVHATLSALRGSVGDAVVAAQEFASGVEVETARLRTAMTSSQTEVQAFGAASRLSADHVGQLAQETDRLTSAAGEAGTMLDSLTKLIESVERFVAPGTRARARAK